MLTNTLRVLITYLSTHNPLEPDLIHKGRPAFHLAILPGPCFHLLFTFW